MREHAGTTLGRIARGAAPAAAEQTVRNLVAERLTLGELVGRYGPAVGSGLSNVLTGYHLGLVGRTEVLTFVRENLRELS